MITLLVFLAATEETVKVSPWNWMLAVLAALGGGGGLFGAWHGYTRDRRTQRLEQQKADRIETAQLREDNRRLEAQVQELRDREWEQRRDKMAAHDRILRMESSMEEKDRKITRLERRVAELEGRSPGLT